ncbi:GRIP1-associated protein [Schistosoma japonicum]|uniref:GRIP1-associated protein n=1 Tax=Schistosoma japonicum TaxID=6182 RepID=A0A4Z2CV40_SCHJA|nr:GRIP1-associated protein [Schistosoma japonicum]
MVTSISAEEFQRFQSQLLDLREAQITANDARLRAEKRVKQLEEELLYTQTALTEAQTNLDRSYVEELKQENKLLRDKLLSTESSFQLQSSTLRAECHRLTNELEKLSNDVNNSNNKRLVDNVQFNSQYCQTTPSSIQHRSIQVNNNDNDNTNVPTQRIFALKQSIEYLNNKVCTLEDKLLVNFTDSQQIIHKLTVENEYLSIELSKSQEKCNQLEIIENDLRNQIDVIKRRSEKLNHELRRQLSRFIIRGQNGDVESVAQLRKNSVHSSSSSLCSSHINSNNNNNTVSVTSTSDEIMSDLKVNGKVSNVTMSKCSFNEMPLGFFSTADFKAIIDRMSEVQEENCTLRRYKKRLEADLLTKSQIIQNGLDNYLNSYSFTVKQSTSNDSNTSLSTTTTTTTSSSSSFPLSTTSYSSSMITNNNTFPNTTIWFPFLKNFTSNSNSSSSSTTTLPTSSLSSVNLPTVNRLKLMCEELLTENIALKEKITN